MINKRGISTLVATVLLVLIVVAAAGVINSFVIPLISNIQNIADACTNAKLQIDTLSGYTCFNSEQKAVEVMVAHGADNLELAGIAISISASGKTKKFVINQNLPASLDSKVYGLDISNEFDVEAIDKILVAPIVKIGTTQKECTVTSFINNIKKCVEEIPAELIVNMQGRAEQICGNGICEDNEDAISCSKDCCHKVYKISEEG